MEKENQSPSANGSVTKERSRAAKTQTNGYFRFSSPTCAASKPSCSIERNRRSRSRSYSRSRERRRYSPSLGSRRDSDYSSTPHRNLEQQRAKLHPKPSCCIGVFGLCPTTGAANLQSIFSKFGPIRDIYLVKDATTGHSRGFAFIYFEHQSDAKYAVQSSSYLIIHGRKVRVDYSITKQPHKSTPGIYMGRDRRERTFYRRSERVGYSDYEHRSSEHRDYTDNPTERNYQCDNHHDFEFQRDNERGHDYQRDKHRDHDYQRNNFLAYNSDYYHEAYNDRDGHKYTT